MRAILLIALMSGRGDVVSDERLTVELWGRAADTSGANALYTQISKLRSELQRLEPDRKASRLRRHRGGGYRIELTDGESDGKDFLNGVDLLDKRKKILSSAKIAEEARGLLGLWRGPVFGGITGGPVCQEATRSYEGARLRVLETLYDMELENGRHADIIANLTELAMTRTAYQVPFAEQAMIALYRSGRQADAVELYHRVRADLTPADTASARRLRLCNLAVQTHTPLLELPAPRLALTRAS